MNKTRFTVLITVVIFVFMTSFFAAAFDYRNENAWPKRVLITNDNGIEDIKIIELARAFAEICETYVVAPAQDRSGSTHYLTATQTGRLAAERRQIGNGIRAYAVDGFPADCVLLALNGIMKDNPPDLVISGINGGPNLGISWLFSGTVGAARVAAFAGVPAISVSGLNDDMTDAVKAANRWVVRLAQTKFVRDMKELQYLTVSIPRLPPADIKGVRVVKRSTLVRNPMFDSVSSADAGSKQELWKIVGFRKPVSSVRDDSDTAVYKAGYIVVVPMICDEHDYKSLSHLNENRQKLPEWIVPEGETRP